MNDKLKNILEKIAIFFVSLVISYIAVSLMIKFYWAFIK